jgi:hypothetical protein
MFVNQTQLPQLLEPSRKSFLCDLLRVLRIPQSAETRAIDPGVVGSVQLRESRLVPRSLPDNQPRVIGLGRVGV